MEHAALTHEAAAYIIRGGCRGCMAKGKWPGEKETTAHCMCDCPCKNVNDLIRWKIDVRRSLQYMISQISKLGDDAAALYAQLRLALVAMTNKCPTGEEFVALRRTVGEAVPWWDRNMEYRDKKHNKALTAMIERLQDLFIERVGEWTAYMAPCGWQRQKRWGQREWVRLTFEAFKHHRQGKTALHAQQRRMRRYARRRALRRIVHVLMSVYRDEESWLTLVERKAATATRAHVGAVERWVDAVHDGDAHTGARLANRIIHAISAMRMYTIFVTRPAACELRKRNENEKRKRHARWLICARLMCIYKGDKRKETIQTRLREREGLVCANTRDVERVTPRGGGSRMTKPYDVEIV